MGERFHGWKIVALAALSQPLGQGLFGAYQVMVTPLTAEFGATQTQMGLGMTLLVLTGGAVGAVIGPTVDRGPLRALMTAGVCGVLAGGALLSQARELWQVALGACVMAGAASLYGQVPINTLLVNWFVKRRGTAVAFGAMGLSTGAALMPLGMTALIESFGWRNAVLGLSGLAFVVVLPLMRWVVRRPEDIGQWPDGGPAPRVRATVAETEEADVGELLGDPNFWFISLGFGLMMAATMGSGVFLMPHLESLGLTRAQAATAPTLMAMSAFCVKPVIGVLVDRLDMRLLAATTFGLYACSWLVFATQESYPLLLANSLMAGLGVGSLLVLLPVFLGGCFDRRSIGRATGLYVPIGMPFMLLSAPLLGASAERAGSFQPGFTALAVVIAVAVALLTMVRIPRVSLADSE